MFITPVLKEQSDFNLRVMEERAHWLESIIASEDTDWSKRELQWATERALHVAVECTTDVANDIIDALVMREPGSYEDILRVIMEEKVVSADWFNAFSGIIEFRDKLVHRYVSLTADEVEAAAKQYGALFLPYAKFIRTYLGIIEA